MFLGGLTTIPKGGSEVFTLDRDELATLAGSFGDGYFGDKQFWKEVLVTFQHNNGSLSQRKTLSYTDSNDVAMSVSSSAIAGTWSLRDVTIIDFDHGRLVIRKEDIPNINFYDLSITT